jgi:hypothetical protein
VYDRYVRSFQLINFATCHVKIHKLASDKTLHLLCIGKRLLMNKKSIKDDSGIVVSKCWDGQEIPWGTDHIDNPLPSQDPSRPLLRPADHPTRPALLGAGRGGRIPLQHMVVATLGNGLSHGSHTGLDGEAKGLQGLLFLGKYKRYGSRIAGSRFFTRNFLGVGHRKPRHA